MTVVLPAGPLARIAVPLDGVASPWIVPSFVDLVCCTAQQPDCRDITLVWGHRLKFGIGQASLDQRCPVDRNNDRVCSRTVALGENSRRTNPVGNDLAIDEVYVHRAAGPGTPGSTPRLNIITYAM